MDLKEAQKIIHAGLAWANSTDEQQAALRVALTCVLKIEQIQEEA